MDTKRLETPISRSIRRAMLGLTSASLLFTTTLTPLAAQGSGAVPPAAVAAGQAGSVYNAEELEAILAPIALYPDQLLTQMLMAAPYPDQIAAAARWVQDPGNRNLRGYALDMALRPIPWDPAVKSLVPFPQVLEMMASHAEWTAQLAYAVMEQQAATFDAIQRLRRKAWLAGQLRSNARQVVRMDGTLIIIEPAQPTLVYVPVYNPMVVYGAWPYPMYPPYYFPPAYYVPANVLAAGIFFGVGVAIFSGLWGWAVPLWHERHFRVDHNRFEYFRNFHHAPPGDWRDWRGDRWHPPPPPTGVGRLRPPPFRPEPERFRPPPSRPGGEQVRPPPSRPSREQFRPAPPAPSRERFQPPPSRPGGEPFRPAPSAPSHERFQPPPSRPSGEPFRPAPPAPSREQFRPQPRPGASQVQPPRPQPGTGQFRPAPAQPAHPQIQPPQQRRPESMGTPSPSRRQPSPDRLRRQD